MDLSDHNSDGQADPPDHDNKVIRLAERAQEVLEITELEPNDGTFIGKRINPDGSITQYPRVTWWRQRVVRVPATIPHLFAFLREVRKRNICLIRDAPADPNCQSTRRWIARDGREGGFIDVPTRLVPFDFDNVKISWHPDDPERAIRGILAQLGEPWASTSFVWFCSATHGLELDEQKRWTGNIDYSRVRVRIIFLAERALGADEAKALTAIAKAIVPEIDRSIVDRVHINYIQRPHWVEHPGRDVLGDIQTIGWIKGTHDILAVPDDLTYRARWAKAQGHSNAIADHPNAEAAVRGIGSDGEVRAHVTAAVVHLLRANQVPEVVSFQDHAIVIADKLRAMVAQHRDEITANCVRCGRSKHTVDGLLQHIDPDYALWCLNNLSKLHAKTIKLTKEERAETNTATREETFARVARSIERACERALRATTMVNLEWATQDVELLVAPTGSRKSTLMRAFAVQYVTEQPKKTVVILMPRHKLGDEQIELLQREHPNGNYNAAVWRGRHADDPETPDPQHPGKYLKMCRRAEEAQEVEVAMLDVESSLCKRGRGDKTIKCPFYDTCAYQQQKPIKANIWFAAHECAVHEMPKTFGDVGWVIFDESPLDAFMFGVDINDPVTLELDTLRTPLPVDPAKLGNSYRLLGKARKAVYDALDKLLVPIDPHQGVAVPRENLDPFIFTPAWGSYDMYFEDFVGYVPRNMRNLTWRGKVDPDIRPDTPKEQLKTKLEEAAVNATIKKEVTLWELIEAVGNHKVYGRIQVHRGKEGRRIHMVGLERPAKGWDVPTLICDATGVAELLKPIWPQLKEAEPHGWEQLPRPPNVRVFQCVNRPISKWAVAVEGKYPKELERKIEGARRLYAAVLTKALEYGGADVGVIIYKSTKDWILKNRFVPAWIKLVHWGDVTGTNTLQRVRALFVIGRPLASAEDVTRQAEALFGAHIPQRDYVVRRKQGRIPIVPTAAGNNCILVDVQEHPHPMAERLRRQITEGNIIQATGRARAGLREANEPLDLHLWTDVPIPGLGPVEPVLWSELAAGLDGLMLATEGVWLRNITDAVRAYKGLFTADGLKDARTRGQTGFAGGPSVLPTRGRWL